MSSADIKNTWRARLDAAAQSYRLAREDYNRAIKKFKAESIGAPAGNFVLRQALQKEHAARVEYLRY